VNKLALTLVVVALAACAPASDRSTAADARSAQEEAAAVSPELDPIAEAYVKLVLAVGQHDGDYVDAYYGPAEWREAVEDSAPPLDEIAGQVAELRERVAGIAVPEGDEMLSLRHRYLTTQLGAVAARVDMLGGKKLSFDEESRALYDAVAPTNADAHFQAILDELEPLLPGEGSLIERFDAFRSGYVIPPDRVDAVFSASIDACRERTGRFIDLPAGESFEVGYVTDKSWSAYNWYKGGLHSLIQVNTDLPIYIDRAIDLACHEGYPGHHVYNALLEQHLVRGRGWVEFSVYPLFSPQSLIAEGTANYGIQMAFPGEERVAFEAEQLFPLAGLDPASASRYYEVLERVEKLAYAGNEAARRYLNGEIDAEAAAAYLTKYALMPPARAAQRVRFMDQYRSYVINYNLGQDLVARFIESRAPEGGEKAWSEFSALLSSPRLPSGLN
jgi:hypothetical protein